MFHYHPLAPTELLIFRPQAQIFPKKIFELGVYPKLSVLPSTGEAGGRWEVHPKMQLQSLVKPAAQTLSTPRLAAVREVNDPDERVLRVEVVRAAA